MLPVKLGSSESINSQFSKARYIGVEVVLMNENGYVNATKLCEDGGKRFDNWVENKSNKGKIEFLYRNQQMKLDSAGKRVESKPITIQINDGNMEEDLDQVRGTYVHPYLLPHIASWISNEIACRTSTVMLNYANKKHKEEVQIQEYIPDYIILYEDCIKT